MTSPTQAPGSTRRAILNTIKGSAGNLVEWYDVYIYTVFALYFENQFASLPRGVRTPPAAAS